MKILMATSEFSPLASTGELGDQVRILTTELKRLNHEVAVVMPLYRSIRESSFNLSTSNIDFQVNLGGKRVSGDVVEITTPEGIQVYFIRRDEYFDRSGIYGAHGRAYEDNAERFIFFARAALELAGSVASPPELIHCHDWPTALVPVFVKDRRLPFQTVLTVHDLEYQGSFWSFDFALTSLSGSYFGTGGVEFYGRLNFLKGGILHADAVTLPGEVAMFEAFTSQRGYGLDGVLQENQFHVFGTPHGVDYSQTNPPCSELFAENLESRFPNGKKGCRRALLEQLELVKDPKGIVINLPIESDDGAAFNYVKPILDLMLTADTCLVVTGTGSDLDVTDMIIAERKYPARLAYRPEADTKLRQAALAGSDVILLPSSLGFHGANALAAMRYGTVPIVRDKGGVHQLVSDYDSAASSGCGFIYNSNAPLALWDAVRRANDLYHRPEQWNLLTERAESVDFSWVESAKAFGVLYANLLRHRPAKTVAAC
jgi:starch synthase